MRGTVSFHPIDTEFFDRLIQPLVAGEKVNPEAYVSRVLRVRSASVLVRRYQWTLARLIEESEPPPAPESAGRWQKLRTWMERIDYKVDPLAKLVAGCVNPDLHLNGRPFLIADGSADVADGFGRCLLISFDYHCPTRNRQSIARSRGCQA